MTTPRNDRAVAFGYVIGIGLIFAVLAVLAILLRGFLWFSDLDDEQSRRRRERDDQLQEESARLRDEQQRADEHRREEALRLAAEREARLSPVERAQRIAQILSGRYDAGVSDLNARICLAVQQRALIAPAERMRPEIRPVLQQLASAEQSALRNLRAEFARSPTRMVRCCDGNNSPNCTCTSPHRGCCSRHDGMCGCEPLPSSLCGL